MTTLLLSAALMLGLQGQPSGPPGATLVIPRGKPGGSAGHSAAPSTPSPAGTRLDGNWTLQSALHEGEPVQLSAGRPLGLSIQGSQIGGFSGCNSFGALMTLKGFARQSFTVYSATVSIGRSIHTMMACLDEQANRTEQVYMGLLTSAGTVTLKREILTFSAPDGSALVYTRDR